ncbi:tape measure protein [Lactobacillus amylovorus]|uniref:tape measure protein n=1 Tax=Lactobacillus amylovorus TaxID=1604 RepID=UPI00232B6F32|nr:tape measure protein [Lactobacillus amylovorus]MDB6229203.1 tape measure protein [Lactobacillus amylovorus]
MAADGVVTLDFDVPIDKLESDITKANQIIKNVGKDAGDQMDQSFRNNSEKVKNTADTTSQHIKSQLDKKVETKISANTTEAKKNIDDISHRTAHIPKEHNTKLTVSDHISGVLDRIRGKSTQTESKIGHLGEIIKGTFIGGLASNAVSSVWSHLTGWIGQAVDMGKQYALEQQTMLASWTTLTGSASKGQAMVDMTNKMAIAANNSTKMVDQLNQKLYAVTNNAGETGKLTHAILTLQDAFGADDAAIANFSVQYSQMIGNGKAQAMDMMSIQNVFPKFKEELLEYMKLQTHNHKLSMEQLNDMISHGEITSDIMNKVLLKMGKQYAGATENFSKTIPGMMRTIESTMPMLLGKITQPFAKAANPIIGTISNWITSKKTEGEFEKLGTTSAEGMNKVINAFAGKSSNSKQLIDDLNGSLENLNKWLGRVFDYIAAHAKDIKQVSSDLWTIAKTLGKDVWNDYASLISKIADFMGLTAKNAGKARTPLGQLESVIHAIAKNKSLIQGIANAIVTIAAVRKLNKVLDPLKEIANLKVGKGTVLDLLKNNTQSIKSAHGRKKLNLGSKATIGLSVAVNGADIIKDIQKATSTSNSKKREKAIGSAIGETLGTGIGAYKWGGLGALIGGKIGAQAVSSFKKKWKDVSVSANVNLKTGKNDQTPGEKRAGANHRIVNVSPLKILQGPEGFDEYVSSLFQNLYSGAYHINDPKWAGRLPAGDNGLNKAAIQQSNGFYDFLKKSGFLKWQKGNRKLENDEFEIPKNSRKNGLQKWWSDQTKSLNKQFKPLTNAKVDWGWLDPKKNGFDNWLKGFQPQVHGKAPKHWQLKASGILPKIDVDSWIKNIQKKLGGFKLKLPKIHLPKIHFPRIRLPKLDVKGWLVKIGKYIHKHKFPRLKAPKWLGWDKLKATVSETWNKIVQNTQSKAGSLWNHAKSGFNALKQGSTDTLKAIKSGWHSMWNGLSKWFIGIWDSIKKHAQNGINGVVDVINGGISGINGLIHDFGGKTNTIGKISHVKLATGTGAFSGPRRPITQRTLALLNDGQDSPSTGNREMIWDRNTGAMHLVPGKNTLAWLSPGQEVFNARETAQLLGVDHFAKGTGFLSGIADWAKGVWNGAVRGAKGLIRWFKEAVNIVSHPSEALNSIFKFSSSGFKGLFNDLAPDMFKQAKKGALSWWNQLWSMVGSKLDNGGATANSKLVSEMMKLGEGKPYVWGATGPSAYDCSGLVMAAARKLGVSLPHYSGSQYAATVPVSHPQPGDLVFFGKGGSAHVGGYMGKDTYYSAQSPSAGIGVGKISAVHEGPVSYRRIKGLSQGSSSKVSAKGVSNKRIYQQVGSGFWKFIGKLADLFGDHMSNPAGDGVERWRPAVKRALAMLHLSSSLVNRVLKQMQTESGGNPHAMGGTDGLNDGHAEGLMQVKPGTFAAYKLRGHNNIWNGFDNLLAGLNYAKHKYGSSLYYLGQGHGYRDGGKVYTPQIAAIAEDGAEYVINPNKPSFERLMKDAIHERAQKDPAGMAAKLDHILNFDNLKYSSANGYRYYSASSNGQQADGGAHIVQNVTDGSNQVKGNVNMIIKLDSDVITRKVYPKSKLMQAKEIDIAQMGGAIPVV